uniref:RWD domain-containing protein n=1 Tax=Chromera velia CCMP2878 TaxID=1169474 RepID=A0A0G4FJI8_9ALVE|eukprot:Cvel_17183.t1-p1 / transcript=Cvel_17183.t1 / gene=Cvel_17183 / organism=Chromera_velia_CCMP2878 / gene_product=RWD domain-containing protein 2B, putative / transcript_product=RWD domain-containing protein 2B, putative / location=Cvel_scaffold1357:32211-43209(-) / protein_length=484 / sequence_SO=supercontig / SO=protein_coding / is_pseudo=false
MYQWRAKEKETALSPPDQAAGQGPEESGSAPSRSEVCDALTRQLEELEAVQAMYSLDGIIEFDEQARNAASAFCKCPETATLPPLLSLLVTLARKGDGGLQAGRVSMSVSLPLLYPQCDAPKFCVVSGELPPSRCERIAASARTAAEEVPGQECLFQVVEAARESCREQIAEDKREELEFLETFQRLQGIQTEDAISGGESEEEDGDGASSSSGPRVVMGTFPVEFRRAGPPVLGRRLLYSHHIRAESKKRAILEWAAELGLGGYSKVGYPGVIVVEGDEQCVQEYVSRLQRLRWKHFVVRGEQITEGREGGDLDSMRALPRRMSQLGPEEMSQLASLCRQAGLEDLFLTSMKIYRGSQAPTAATGVAGGEGGGGRSSRRTSGVTQSFVLRTGTLAGAGRQAADAGRKTTALRVADLPNEASQVLDANPSIVETLRDQTLYAIDDKSLIFVFADDGSATLVRDVLDRHIKGESAALVVFLRHVG